MADKKNLKKTTFKLQTKRMGPLPEKRSLNLATVGVTKLNYAIMVPSVIIIVLVALIFSKVAVVDRMLGMSEAQEQAAQTKTQLDETLAQINDYDDVTNDYAHYTYSGMTSEESNRADRMDAIYMVNKIVLPQATVSDWSITENQMDLTIIGSSLQQLNQIAAKLEEEELVDFCTVKTAATDKDTTEDVTGQMTIYLVGAEEGGDE